MQLFYLFVSVAVGGVVVVFEKLTLHIGKLTSTHSDYTFGHFNVFLEALIWPNINEKARFQNKYVLT